jgi:phenylalanine-4-hydroxylase
MENRKYEAKLPNQYGLVPFTPEEHSVWETLYLRQQKLLEGRACPEFIHGIKALDLGHKSIPTLPDICAKLGKATGWGVTAVNALISFKEFFELLANRHFPVATFIRVREDLDYLKEPDIFHEVFGHCPLLTLPAFASFTEKMGQWGMKMNREERVMLARLYWFTVEFGLINTKEGLRIYGGGILSSKGESVYALESPAPMREKFDLIQVLRTPYRYDEMQKKYFIIDSFDDLFAIAHTDLPAVFKEARKLGVITDAESDVRAC